MARKEPPDLFDLACHEAQHNRDWETLAWLHAEKMRIEREHAEQEEQEAVTFTTVILWALILGGAMFVFWRVAG